MKWVSMGFAIGILLMLWVFSEIDAQDAENRGASDQMTVADSLYQTAVDALDRVPIKESIDAFKRVLKADDKYASAHYRLSQLYAALNTVNDRQRANRALKEAIRLDPNNINYQLALGDLFWQQEFWSRAEEQYQKAFQSDSLNAEAAFQIGSRALDAYLKYKDQQHLNTTEISDTRLGPNYQMVYWKLFGDRDLERATTFLERATQIDPTYRNAYYRLGLAYYESNRPDQLVQICARLSKYEPGDKDALLFMALGFQATNQLNQSNKLFNAALKRMNPDERAVMESLELIADSETQYQIQQAETGSNSQTQIDSNARTLFWQKQDPLYLTNYNERRMAHYGRVAYANLRYSHPERSIPGWQTEMGKAYIKYGRPLKRSVKRMDVNHLPLDLSLNRGYTDEGTEGPGVADKAFGGGGGNFSGNFQTETWNYEHFRLEFVQADGYNGRLITSTPDSSRYVDPYIKTKYNTPHQILAFKENASLRIEVAYALPSRRFNGQSTTVDDGLFIFDPNGQEIDNQIRHADVFWPQAKSHWDQYYIVSRQMHLSPGTYDILVESYDQKTGQIATFRETRNLTISDSSLSMSDLFLARSVQEKIPFPESHHDLSILPNPTRTYGPNDPVYVYLEVYNLKRNEFGRTRFDMSYHISAPDKEEIDPALFIDQNLARQIAIETFLSEAQPLPNLEDSASVSDARSAPPSGRAIVESRIKYVLPKSRETEQLKIAAQEGVEMATSVTAEYEGDHTDDFTYLQLDVSQLPRGIHKLTIAVVDRFANTQTLRHTLFRVVE